MNTYALTDLHGRKDLWDFANKELFQPDDIIYFLGDAVDRGPDGYELMKTLLMDSRVIYLKGNHEDMFARAIDDHFAGVKDSIFNDYIKNEAKPTWQAWQEDGEYNWIPVIERLPEFKIYTNANGQKIFLSHAGCNPWQKPWNLLWDRQHFLSRYWRKNDVADIIVHGHTPIPYLATPYKPRWEATGAFWYCSNHKVDLDSYAVGTGIAFILNLDTLTSYMVEGQPMYDYMG